MLLELDDEFEFELSELFDEEFELELSELFELELPELFDEEFELELSELFELELSELFDEEFELELSELFELELSELFDEEFELELPELFDCQAAWVKPGIRSALATGVVASAAGMAAFAPVATMAPATIIVSFVFMLLSFLRKPGVYTGGQPGDIAVKMTAIRFRRRET